MGTLHSSKTQVKHIHGVSKYRKRIYANVTLNDKYIVRLKVDTGTDICALNVADIGKIPIGVNLQPDNSILEGSMDQAPSEILGVTDFKVIYRGKSIQTQFNVIDCPGKPSILGYISKHRNWE